MRHISKLPNVGTTIFTVMGELANKHNAINLAQGFPNFESDSKLIDLVANAMREGYNQYAPLPGIMELRVAIANKFNLLYNTNYDPHSEITVTAGATQAIYTIISTFINKGDEVLIFTPAYDCYGPAIELNKGKVIPIQLKAPNFEVDWEEVGSKINSNTRMFIINSPHNPSGTLLHKNDMLKLQQLLKSTDIILLSDEVYEHIIFENEEHQSACLFNDLKSRSFVVASFGKTFHNTGWKIGYCCAPKILMDEYKKVHQFNVFCVNHPVQKGLADYIKNPENYQNLSELYERKRNLFLSLIKESRFKFKASKGTYFQSLDYSEITDINDVEFAKKLTKANGIASIPLSVFNADRLDQKMLRFCFAKTDETLVNAAKILCQI